MNICHGNGKSCVIGEWWTISVSSGSLSFIIIIPDLSDAHFYLLPSACWELRYMLIRQISLSKN